MLLKDFKYRERLDFCFEGKEEGQTTGRGKLATTMLRKRIARFLDVTSCKLANATLLASSTLIISAQSQSQLRGFIRRVGHVVTLQEGLIL